MKMWFEETQTLRRKQLKHAFEEHMIWYDGP